MMRSEIINDVKEYALVNYNQRGWDFVVETMTDEELSEEIGTVRTTSGAIRKVGKLVKLLDEVRHERMASWS